MGPDQERRTSTRLGAVRNRAAVQLARSSGHRKVAARMVNICPEGALVVMGEKPELGTSLWLRLEAPVKTDWIWASPVRLGAPGEVGLRFDRPCPGDFLLATTMGIDFGSMLGIDRGVGSTCEIAVPDWFTAGLDS